MVATELFQKCLIQIPDVTYDRLLAYKDDILRNHNVEMGSNESESRSYQIIKF